jgi:N,N'-diacetylbacillosaminyl-diphospho-undecaprenol alpha-1,3-N-acetylgalactosaminyltransferase
MEQLNKLIEFVFIHLGLIDTASAGFLSGDSIKDYAAKSGVFYLGFVENIRDYISASDIMVLPSIYREGTPRSLIEALALGKVIVTTDMPGCRETVIDGWNGFFCKGGDINSLVSKILAIDNKFILQATERSRNLCLVKYDSTLLIEKTLACYKDSLKKSACSNL